MQNKTINHAIKVLKAGGLIIFPTETVYGIGCDLFNKKAVAKIYQIKKREKRKPLAALVYSEKQAETLAKNISKDAKTLMKRYFPGPLTVVLRKRKIVPDMVTAGGKTIAVRCPDHPLTLKLLKKFGPIVGTSANLSGGKDPRSVKEISKNLKNKVDHIINGGRARIGIPSTVVDATTKKLKILRQGPQKPILAS